MTTSSHVILSSCSYSCRLFDISSEFLQSTIHIVAVPLSMVLLLLYLFISADAHTGGLLEQTSNTNSYQALWWLLHEHTQHEQRTVSGL